MRPRRGFCLLTALLFLGAAGLPAASAWSESRPEDLRIRLVTIGTGGPLYTWWGHTGLIVEDPSRGLGRFYNYGLFSFAEDNFFLNFARGRLVFAVGASSPERELALYRDFNRSIRIQTLNLVPDRRRELALYLEWNVRPENRDYLYDHYRDNCATRVRDLIDETIDGQLADRTASGDGRSFREHTRRHTARHPLMDWLLMFLMGSSIDRPVSPWEAMFLPSELEKAVDTMTYTDPRGELRPLVSERQDYYRARGRKAVPDEPPLLWPGGLLTGLLAAALALALRLPAAGSPACRRLYRLYQSLIALVLGIPGTALLLMSRFTDHTVTYGNANLLLANPLTLLAVPLGIWAAAGSPGARLYADRLWNLLACLGLAALLARLLPGFIQDNRFALATILPVTLMFASPPFGRLRRKRRTGRRHMSEAGTVSEKP